MNPAQFAALFSACGASKEWAASTMGVPLETVEQWLSPLGTPPAHLVRHIEQVWAWENHIVQAFLEQAEELTARGHTLTLWLYATEEDFFSHALPDELKSAPSFWAWKQSRALAIALGTARGLLIRPAFIDFLSFGLWLEMNNRTDAPQSRWDYLSA